MGSCNEQHARWYFEQEHKKCTPFYYTGCEGNDNNYRSLEECEQQCPSPIGKKNYNSWGHSRSPLDLE